MFGPVNSTLPKHARHRNTCRSRKRSRLSLVAAAGVAAGAFGAVGVAAGATPWAGAVSATTPHAAQLDAQDVRTLGGTTMSHGTALATVRYPASSWTLNLARSPAVDAAPAVKGSAVRASAAHGAAAHAPATRPATANGRVMPAPPYIFYDSVTPTAIPRGQRVATYANGAYQASPASVAGRGRVLWIDTNGSDPWANALDVEPGDATPAGAAQ